MKAISNLLLGTGLFISLLVSSCSKSDNSPGNTSNTYTAPSLAKDSLIKIPDAINAKATSNYKLTNLVVASTLVDVFSSSLSSAFIYNQSTIDGWKASSNSDGSTSYSFSYAQFSVNITDFQSSGDSWWKYSYDSASYSRPLYYIDDKGTSGEVDWYNWSNFKTSSALALKDSWTKSGSTTNSTFNEYGTDGTTIVMQYVSTSNTDRSGTLNVYGQNTDNGPLLLQWKYSWKADGTGTYTEYGLDGTTVLSSGSF